MAAVEKRRCIFCGAEQLTDEHVWPAWINRILPTEFSFQTVRTRTDPYEGRTELAGEPWSGSALKMKYGAPAGPATTAG